MTQYYIFASDPHGTGQPWIDKVNHTLSLYPKAKIIFGGDYIDGRKYSKETVDYVRSMQAKGHIALRGNHEQLLIDAMNYSNEDLWDINGAKTTIRSFCGRSWGKPKRFNMFNHMNKEYIAWFNSLPYIYETEHNVFVHAGLDFNKKDPIRDTSDYDKIWIRDDYIYRAGTHDTFNHNPLQKTIITGHTPTTFISGTYDDNQTEKVRMVPESCPLIKIQYPNEYARLFTDGGCHGSLPNNIGNVIVVDELGNLVDSY